MDRWLVRFVLPAHDVENWWERRWATTHPNDPVNGECDEVEEWRRFILCVKVVSSHEFSQTSKHTASGISVWVSAGFFFLDLLTCIFCNSWTSNSVKEGLWEAVAIPRWERRERRRQVPQGGVAGRISGSRSTWRVPLICSVTLGENA